MNLTKYLIVTIAISTISLAQLKYNIGIGSGFYFTKSGSFYDNSQNYLSGQLRLGYTYKNEVRKASFDFYALPELYGLDNSIKSLKVKIDASYSEIISDMVWGLSFSKKNYFYTGLGIKNNFDIYFLHSFLDWKIGGVPIRTALGYAYQDISGTYSQTSDMIYLDFRSFNYFNIYSNLSYGIYFERFSLSSFTKNIGYRFGPVIAFNHLQDFVFNLQYKFIFHSSELTDEFTYESILRLVSGKYLSENLSLFLLADYNWRNFKLESRSNVLPYSLIDSENNIHVKLGYNLSSLTEIYLRSGYFNQDYLDRDLSLKGWNILAGIKYGN